MSKINLLRAFVNQRLSVAVDEIFEMFERILVEYDEEIDRQRRLLRAEDPPDARIATSSNGAGLGKLLRLISFMISGTWIISRQCICTDILSQRILQTCLKGFYRLIIKQQVLPTSPLEDEVPSHIIVCL